MTSSLFEGIGKMSINPYQSPLHASSNQGGAQRLRWWMLPTAVVAVIGMANVLLWLLFWLLTPPPGSPGTYSVLLLVITDYLINLPGFPLFFAVEATGLIPTGEDDDLVRGIWFTACSLVGWGVTGWIAGLLFARRRYSPVHHGP